MVMTEIKSLPFRMVKNGNKLSTNTSININIDLLLNFGEMAQCIFWNLTVWMK